MKKQKTLTYDGGLEHINQQMKKYPKYKAMMDTLLKICLEDKEGRE